MPQSRPSHLRHPYCQSEHWWPCGERRLGSISHPRKQPSRRHPAVHRYHSCLLIATTIYPNIYPPNSRKATPLFINIFAFCTPSLISTQYPLSISIVSRQRSYSRLVWHARTQVALTFPVIISPFTTSQNISPTHLCYITCA